jgi:hypothetical protein
VQLQLANNDKEFIMAIYKITDLNDRSVIITSPSQPVINCTNSSHGEKWGGEPTSPAMINGIGEFKTRDQVSEGMQGYGMFGFNKFVREGFALIVAWESVEENLPIPGLEECFTTGYETYTLEFTRCATLPRWIEFFITIGGAEEVLDLRWFYSDEKISVKTAKKEIETQEGDDATYVTYVKFGGSSYRCIIHYKEI